MLMSRLSKERHERHCLSPKPVYQANLRRYKGRKTWRSSKRIDLRASKGIL
jgi:hypothetical protein